MCWVFFIFRRFFSRNLCRISLMELCTAIYLRLGNATEATPHYPAAELRVFGGLGFRVYI